MCHQSLCKCVWSMYSVMIDDAVLEKEKIKGGLYSGIRLSELEKKEIE